jgi:hypothetical protein
MRHALEVTIVGRPQPARKCFHAPALDQQGHVQFGVRHRRDVTLPAVVQVDGNVVAQCSPISVGEVGPDAIALPASTRQLQAKPAPNQGMDAIRSHDHPGPVTRRGGRDFGEPARSPGRVHRWF